MKINGGRALLKCHAELVSASKKSNRDETLNQVQGDKTGNGKYGII